MENIYTPEFESLLNDKVEQYKNSFAFATAQSNLFREAGWCGTDALQKANALVESYKLKVIEEYLNSHPDENILIELPQNELETY